MNAKIHIKINELRERVYEVFSTCNTIEQLVVAERYAMLATRHMTSNPHIYGFGNLRVYKKEFDMIKKFKYKTINRVS